MPQYFPIYDHEAGTTDPVGTEEPTLIGLPNNTLFIYGSATPPPGEIWPYMFVVRSYRTGRIAATPAISTPVEDIKVVGGRYSLVGLTINIPKPTFQAFLTAGRIKIPIIGDRVDPYPIGPLNIDLTTEASKLEIISLTQTHQDDNADDDEGMGTVDGWIILHIRGD